MASGKRDQLWRSILTRSAPADVELLDRWRAGDRAAGQELFLRHLDTLRGFFATKCRDADQLARRTLLAAALAEDPPRERAGFRTYLFALARHELYRHLQQRRPVQIDFSIASIAELMADESS